MNERIRELINEATSFKEGLIEEKYDIEVFDKEKFAELFVRECGVALNPMLRDMISRGQAVELIKKHFEQHTGWICPKCGVDRTKDVCPKGHTAAITGDCPMIAIAHTE